MSLKRTFSVMHQMERDQNAEGEQAVARTVRFDLFAGTCALHLTKSDFSVRPRNWNTTTLFVLSLPVWNGCRPSFLVLGQEYDRTLGCYSYFDLVKYMLRHCKISSACSESTFVRHLWSKSAFTVVSPTEEAGAHRNNQDETVVLSIGTGNRYLYYTLKKGETTQQTPTDFFASQMGPVEFLALRTVTLCIT